MELNYNRVELRGVAEDAPLLSHVNHGCAFYRFTLSVLAPVRQADKLPVIVPRAASAADAGCPPATAYISPASCVPLTTKAARAAVWSSPPSPRR